MQLLKNNLFFIFIGSIFLIFLYGITVLPPLDRDESRFASASKNMLETEDFIDIELEGVKRYKKPIGIYWVQVASNMIFGEPPFNEIWTYRLPSLLSIFTSIILVFFTTKRLFNEDVAKLSCLFLVSSLLIISEIHQAKSDGLLLLFITSCNLIVLNFLSRNKRKPSWKEISLFWVFLSLGIMVKGPIILVFVFSPILAFIIFTRSSELLEYFKKIYAYIILLVVVLPWYYLISIKSGSLFWHESLGKDLFSKVISGQESHGFPPGYYSLLIFIFFWPASVFLLDLIPQIFRCFKNKVQISKIDLFLIFSFAIPFVVYELIPTKLPHYVLPTYVPASILISNYLIKSYRSKYNLLSKKIFVFFLLAPLILPIIYIYAIWEYSKPDFNLYLIIFIFILLIFLLIRFLISKKIISLLITSFVFQLWVYISLILYVNPKLEIFWIADKIYSASKSFSDGKIFHYGFNEPSLVFLLSHKSERVPPKLMKKKFYNEPNSMFIVSGKYVKELESLLKNEKTFSNILNFKGFNYSKGKYINVSAFTNESHKE